MTPEIRPLILLLVGLVGLVITAWVLVPPFRARDHGAGYLGTHRLAVASLAAVLIIVLGLQLAVVPFFGITRGGLQGLTLGTFVVAVIFTDTPLVAIPLVRTIFAGVWSWGDLGLVPTHWTKLLLGVAFGLLALGVSAAIEVVLLSLGLRPSNQLQELQFVQGQGVGAFLVALLGVCVVAPFAEELFFRGYLFGMYRRRQPLWVAYVASSLLFSVVHAQPGTFDLSQTASLLPAIFVLGGLLAFLYQQTGSLVPGMIAHGVNNLVGLSVVYFLPQLTGAR